MEKIKTNPGMTIAFTGRHIEITDALKDYAQKKISRLQKYFNRPMDVHVIFTLEKHRHIAEVIIMANGDKISGTSRTTDSYTSVDNVVDKMEKQLLKQKEKRKERKRLASKSKMKNKVEAYPVEEVEFTEFEEESKGGKILRIEKVNAKPMSPDEAAMQMDFDPRPFMVFVNSRTEEINVIYRLANGNYSLITKG
jgi:putative sigma-54 modulation protein